MKYEIGDKLTAWEKPAHYKYNSGLPIVVLDVYEDSCRVKSETGQILFVENLYLSK